MEGVKDLVSRPLVVTQSDAMAPSALTSAIQSRYWADCLCDDETAYYGDRGSEHSGSNKGMTPLYDKLVARGVFPTRNATRWADAAAARMTSQYKNHLWTGLHTVVLALPQLTATDVGTPAICIADNHDVPSPKLIAAAAMTEDVLDPQEPKPQKWLTNAPHDHLIRVGANRRARPFRVQYLVSDGVRQYLAFLDNFRNILLSCSATLAASSSAIVKQAKHDLRQVQEKEFVEYFDVV